MGTGVGVGERVPILWPGLLRLRRAGLRRAAGSGGRLCEMVPQLVPQLVPWLAAVERL